MFSTSLSGKAEPFYPSLPTFPSPIPPWTLLGVDKDPNVCTHLCAVHVSARLSPSALSCLGRASLPASGSRRAPKLIRYLLKSSVNNKTGRLKPESMAPKSLSKAKALFKKLGVKLCHYQNGGLEVMMSKTFSRLHAGYI